MLKVSQARWVSEVKHWSAGDLCGECACAGLVHGGVAGFPSLALPRGRVDPVHLVFGADEVGCVGHVGGYPGDHVAGAGCAFPEGAGAVLVAGEPGLDFPGAGGVGGSSDLAVEGVGVFDDGGGGEAACSGGEPVGVLVGDPCGEGGGVLVGGESDVAVELVGDVEDGPCQEPHVCGAGAHGV